MHSNVKIPVSTASLWIGSVISALLVALTFLDGAIKAMKLPPAIEGTTRLGYPASLVFPLGAVCLPQTSILGAILLTGYFGGATATQVRVQNPWFLLPVGLGMLAWVGLFLRHDRLRAFIQIAKVTDSSRKYVPTHN